MSGSARGGYGERALQRLRRDLLEAGAASVETVAGAEAPTGAKGLAMVCELLVAVTAGTLHVVLPLVLEPFTNHRRAKVRLAGPDGQRVSLDSLTPEALSALASRWNGPNDSGGAVS